MSKDVELFYNIMEIVMNSRFELCPICESKKIKKKIGNFEVLVENKEIVVPDITFFICTECKEKFTDVENEIKIDDFIKFAKRKNAA